MSKELCKYFQLKKMVEDSEKDRDDFPELSQYLHIVQVMEKEEEAYERHRNEMFKWLKEIEKSIKSKFKISGIAGGKGIQ